jgi:hypothetical protein
MLIIGINHFVNESIYFVLEPLCFWLFSNLYTIFEHTDIFKVDIRQTIGCHFIVFFEFYIEHCNELL